MFRQFLKSTRGNVAMMFGLVLIPMLIGAGVGIDMLRANDIRSRLTQASDAGLLAAARAMALDSSISEAQAKSIARRYFDANGVDFSDIVIDSFDFDYDPATDKYTLDIVGRIKTEILSVAGRDWMPLVINAEAKMAPPRVLELMLVLDSTNSMAGQKMIDLKDAARDLVTSVMKPANNTVKVGVVPFSTHVRIGVARGGEYWISVPPDGSYSYNSCTVDNNAATAAGCSRQPATCYNDGVPRSCQRWQCPSGVTLPRNCETRTRNTTWLGCVGSRSHPLNIEDGSFLSNPAPGVLNNAGSSGDCPSEILPMTTVRSTVLANITAMNTQGNTYIPGGLSWGLRLISNAEPFTQGVTYGDLATNDGVKAIVLMTDGENTKSPNNNGAHYGNNVTLADQYTIEMCDEIKDEDIKLYTIAFEVTDSDTLTMLQNCATSSSEYFNATNATQLAAAFEAIGDSLNDLALTR